MSKVLLLSGLGPGRLDQEDLVGTCFDEKLVELVSYSIDEFDYSPFNLVRYEDGNIIRILKKKQSNAVPTLVNTILEQILIQTSIPFDSYDLSCVWENKDIDFYTEYDVVCLSTTFMWSEEMFSSAINWINTKINYKYLVVGGKYSSLKKDSLLLKFPSISYLVVGDGEKSLTMLLDFLVNKEGDIDSIPNLLYVKSGKLERTLTEEIVMETLPIATPKTYSSKIVMYESVRGCIRHCKFCGWSSGIEKFRFKSAEKIIKEWKEYKDKHNIEEIQVVDSTFLFPNNRMKILLDNLKELSIRWKANSRTDIPVSKDYVAALEQSGCVSLKFGFESMSDKILGYMNKQSTAEQNRLVNSFFRQSSIDTICSFIIGFPGETYLDFKETEDYLVNEHYGHFHLYIFSLEDECMPIWKEKDRFKIVLYNNETNSFCHQDGRNWSHIGMNSKEAEIIRKKALQRIRIHSKYSVHRSWQTKYNLDLAGNVSKEEILMIERLIDKLTFAPIDYSSDYDRENCYRTIRKDLEKFNIFYNNDNTRN